MADSPLRLIKRCVEFQPLTEVGSVPKGRRGIYVLYKRRRKNGHEYYNVVYVGMSRTGIRSRLISHRKTKAKLWTHFSAFEVWENIRDEEIIELEGLFRHLYRFDATANKLAVAKRFNRIFKVRVNFDQWT